MKRRNLLIGGTAAIAAAAAVVPPKSLYGAPASLKDTVHADAEKFHLPLGNAGVPYDTVSDVAKVAAFWERVLDDETEAAAFARNPSQALTNAGLDASDSVLLDETVRSVAMMSRADVQSALSSQDYPAFLSILKSNGFLDQTNSSDLQQRYAAAIRKNQQEMEEFAQSSGVAPASLLGSQDALPMGTATTDDMVATTSMLLYGRPDLMPELRVTNVASAINFAVAVQSAVVAAQLAAIALYVYASSAVYVYGTTPADSAGPSLPSAAKNFVGVDPVAMRNTQRVFKLMTIKSSPGAVMQAINDEARFGLTAFVNALRQEGVSQVSEEQVGSVVDSLLTYSWKASGLA